MRRDWEPPMLTEVPLVRRLWGWLGPNTQRMGCELRSSRVQSAKWRVNGDCGVWSGLWDGAGS